MQYVIFILYISEIKQSLINCRPFCFFNLLADVDECNQPDCSTYRAECVNGNCVDSDPGYTYVSSALHLRNCEREWAIKQMSGLWLRMATTLLLEASY